MTSLSTLVLIPIIGIIGIGILPRESRKIKEIGLITSIIVLEESIRI
jgi:hypothetical protein